MKHTTPFLFFITIVFLASCSPGRSRLLKSALEKAGANQPELEKVLRRYSQDPEDSLKYRAACFLIENMPYYSFYEGELLEQYGNYYKSLHEYKKNRAVSSLRIYDSIETIYGKFNLEYLTRKRDIEVIDSAFLCDNIEWSFKVWEEQPWGKSIDFDRFCEMILPYRIRDEKPTLWKPYFYAKYHDMLREKVKADTLGSFTDPAYAAKALMDSLNKLEVYLTSKTPPGYPHVGPKYAEYLSGTCREFTDFAVYASRALGIPCHIDYMPLRSNHYVGHLWISYYDNEGNLYCQDFPGNLRKVSEDWIRGEPKLKVYRHTFRKNEELEKVVASRNRDVPSLLNDVCFTDVTQQYAHADCYADELRIPVSALYSADIPSGSLYACASSRMGWTPVAWGEQVGDSILFRSVQKGSLYRLGSWQNGDLQMVTDPFVLDCKEQEVSFLSPATETQPVVLYAKFSLHADNEFRKKMVGGVFEASNDRHFRKPDTLHVINDLPYRLMQVAHVKQNKKYRYVRYVSPQGGYLNIAELSFAHMADTGLTKISGEIIGHFAENARDV